MPTISLSICGIRIVISADSPVLTDLFLDYFRYYEPQLSQPEESLHNSRENNETIDLDLRMLDRLPPRERLIPPQAKLFSQTGVLGLWRENTGASESDRFYFYMGVAAFAVEPGAGKIIGYITSEALEHPQILANTYVLFPLLLLLRSRGIYHLHAAAVISPSGKLWLICGSQRAGKTTLTTALGLAGWRPISDDSLLLGFAGSNAHLTALKKNFHLGDELLNCWTGLKAVAQRDHYLDRTCIDGLEFFKTRELADSQFERVDYVLLPQVTNKAESGIAPIAGSEALLKLAEQSMFFQLWREHVERQWKALGELARNSSCYKFFSGTDLLDDPRRAAEILKNEI